MRTAFSIAALVLTTLPACAQDDTRDEAGRAALIGFVRSHEKRPWRYGPPDQTWADPTWTWRAVRILEIAGASNPPNDAAAREIAEWAPGTSWRRKVMHARLQKMLGHPLTDRPSTPLLRPMSNVGSPPLADLESIVELQVGSGAKIQADMLKMTLRLWRGRDGGWRWPATLDETYELLRARKLYTKIPEPPTAPSSMGATAAAVRCYRLAGLDVPEKARAVARIRAALTEWGYYVQGTQDHEPTSHLWSTWHALRALNDLGAKPDVPELTVRWIRSLRHETGGFAHSATEPASLEATWLAMECLHALGATVGPLPERPLSGRLPPPGPSDGLRLFQAVVEMGPDPGTSAALAKRIGADLLLIKSLEHGEVGLARRAQAVAERLGGKKLHVACVREEHLRAWGVPGLGYATHCSDVCFDPADGVGERHWYRDFDGILNDWKIDRLKGSIVFSASHIHRELLAPAYDRIGALTYDALMATWAFAPGGDVVREYPWLHRYVGRRSLIGNHDAHGDPFHWLHRGLRSRTLFFAKTGDQAGFVEAVHAGRTVAVAHTNTDDVTLWGHPHWTARARAARGSWDIGRRDGLLRADDRGVWLPAPVAFPIDASTHAELPDLPAGHGIVVRAARVLGDDALPDEVTLTVDERPVPLSLVHADHDGPPALWAALPTLSRGAHDVRVTAFGRSTSTRLDWGAPIEKVAPRRPAEPPRALRFEGAADVPWVRGALSRDDFAGSVRIGAARTDFIVGSGSRPGHVRIRWTGGDGIGVVRLALDAVTKVEITPDGRPGEVTIPVPGELVARRSHRIIVRTKLRGWTLPMAPAHSDLRFVEVAWESEP